MTTKTSFVAADTTFKVAPLSLLTSTDPLCGTFGVLNKTVLTAMGYTKYICPFGVLIVGKKDYLDDDMLLAANFIANILDPKATGTVGKDDVSVYYELREKIEQEKGVFLSGGSTDEDKTLCEAVEPVAKALKATSKSAITSSDLAAQLLKIGISSTIPGMSLFPLRGCVPLPPASVFKVENKF